MIVLILDDHPPIIEFLAIKLQEINSELTILEANTVEQALHLLESQEVQRVVCDLQIISGKNMAIPNRCHKMGIPFMVYSSHVNYSLIKELKTYNITCYISKGSKIDSLKEGLKNLLKNTPYFCSEVQKEQLNHSLNDVPRPKLSKSEHKIVKAYALGMNTSEVAKNLGLKEVTIRNHRARATDKNLCSFSELIAAYKYWED